MPSFGGAANQIQTSNTAPDLAVQPGALEAQGQAPGAQTLTAALDAPGAQDPAQRTSTLGSDLVATIAHLTMTPLLTYVTRGVLQGVRGSLALDANDATPIAVTKLCAQAALAISEIMVAPAIDMVIDKLKDVYNEPRAKRDVLQDAVDHVQREIDLPAIVDKVDGLSELRRRSPHQWATALRPYLVGAVQLGVTGALYELAAQLTFTMPAIAISMRGATPLAARATATVFSYALDRQLPLVDVDADTLPARGSNHTLLCALATRVVSLDETVSGSYAVALEVTGPAATEPLTGAGTLTVRMLDNGLLESIDDLSRLTLEVPPFTLTQLVGRYTRGVGLEITSGKMTSHDERHAGVRLALQRLAISPFGWVSGSFLRDGEQTPFGSQFPKLWPGDRLVPDDRMEDAEQVVEPPEPSAEPPAPSNAPGDTLAGNAHTAFQTAAGKLMRLASPLAKLAHYATGGANLVAPRGLVGARPPRVTQPPKPPSPASSVRAWLAQRAGVDGDKLLEWVGQQSLVPSGLRERIRLSADDLAFGHEPSVRFGMSLGVTPFPGMGADAGLEAPGLQVTWLIDQSPFVVFAAPRIQLGPLELHGIEADPASGLRIAEAMLELPVPSIAGVLSLGKIAARGERITIGRGFDARLLRAAVGPIQLVDGLLGAESLTISYGRGDNADHRFTAALIGGRLAVGGDAPFAVGFAGEFSWSRGHASGAGSAQLDQDVRLFDALTLSRGSELSGKLDGSAFQGQIKGELEVAVQGKVGRARGTAEVDNRGIARVVIERASLHQHDGAEPHEIFSLAGFTYDRDGRRLRVAELRVDVPHQGALRGVAERDGRSALVLANVDLSSLLPVRAPDATAAKPPPDKAAPPSPEAPFALHGDNLRGLELGPAGAPFLELMLAPAAPKASGLAGSLVAHLGPMRASADHVAIHSDADDRTQIEARAERIRIGDEDSRFQIGALAYRQHRLTVTDAQLPLTAALGKIWPAELGQLNGALTASLGIDTRSGAIAEASADLALSGKLFGDHLTIAALDGKLSLSGGVAAGAGGASAVVGGQLSSTLDFRGSIALFGGSIHFTEAKLALAGGKLASISLSATGEIRGATVTIKHLHYAGGNQIRFEEITSEIPAPKDGDVVKFLPPISNATVPRTNDVVVRLKGVGYDAGTGQLLFAEHEEIKGNGEALSNSAAPDVTEVMSIENFGGIEIGNGAVVARVTERPRVDKVRGRNELRVAGGLALELGPLHGSVEGVEIFMPLAPPVPDVAQPTPEVASEAERNHRGRIHVARASLGDGGKLQVENLWAQNGVVTIDAIRARLGDLLGGLAPELGDLAGTTASIHGISITADKQLRVAGLGVELPTLALFDRKVEVVGAKLSLIPGVVALADRKASLLGSGWHATLGATSIVVRPIDKLTLSSGPAQLVMNARGVSGQVHGLEVNWIDKLRAKAERIDLDGTGFDVVNAELGVSQQVVSAVPALKDAMSLLPTWMPSAGDTVIGLRNLSFGYRDGAVKWPTLSTLRFGVRRASFALGPLHAGFDLDAGTITIGGSHKGSFQAMAQLPLGQGVGLEIGGALLYNLGLEGTGSVARSDDDVLRIMGGLKARASLEATLQVGVYGGVPSVFSVSAGVYAGLKLQLMADAQIAGAWPLPIRTGDKGGGAIDALFQLKDGAAYPDLTATAGAYVAFHFLGTSRTLRKQLAAMKIAQLHAHGGMRLRAGEPLALLPEGRFPAHEIHLDPELRALLFGKDFEAEHKRSQKRLSGKFAEVEAHEEMLGIDPAHEQDAHAATDRPWQGQKEQLAHAKAAAQRELDAAQHDVDAFDRADHAGADLLAKLRSELDKYEAQAKKLEQRQGKPSDAIRIGARFHKVVATPEGKPAIVGRPRVDEPDAERRVADPSFPEQRGRATSKVALDAVALRGKAEARKAEIAVIEHKRQDERRLGAEDRLVDAKAAHRKADAKAGLADRSVNTARARLATSRASLLESLYAASKVEVRGADKQLDGAAELARLRREQQQTKDQLAKLGSAPSTPVARSGVESADELERALLTEHDKFLRDEIAFVEARESENHYTGGKFDDKIDDGRDQVLNRAATARPDKARELEQRMKDKMLARRREIEAKLREQSALLEKLARLEAEGKRLARDDERRRACEDAIEVEKQKLAQYVEVIERMATRIEASADRLAS